MPSFHIDKTPAPFGDVWVQLKDQPRGETKPYEIVVPSGEIEVVFDPHGRKPSSQSWHDFISNDIDELGGVILEGYLQGMMSLNGEDTKRCMGVLATVDDIHEADDGIRLHGRVEEWCPDKYS